MSITLCYDFAMSDELDDPGLAAWKAFIFAHTAVVGRIERDLAAEGLVSLTWYDVLTALSGAPDHRLRLHELAQQVALSRSGLTRLLDRIEAAGYVRREPSPGDRRGAYAVMTAEGEAALLRAWPTYARGIAHYFSDHLSDEEKGVLIGALRRVRARTLTTREPDR
jgi:DNA-binding MarR family transcriptional regulator